MKKRKAPIALISMLVVLVGVAVVLGLANSGGGPEVQKPVTEPEQVTKQHESPTSANLKMNIERATTRAVPREKVPPISGSGPSIALERDEPPAAVQRPKPNPDGSTNSQWFR